ncbi:MAG: hypothetical protein ABL917_01390, partial [Parcubacteria group bacterium]
PIVGSYGGSNDPIAPTVVVPQEETKSCYYLYDYLRKDFNNNPVEVRKLQVFLKDLEGFKDIQITGVYDDQTIKYLDMFQSRYAADILTPWGHTAPTSYTYILTKKKVNEIYCKFAFPVTPLQQLEIDTYRNFLQGLKDSGIQYPGSGQNDPLATSSPSVIGEVGSNNGSGSNTDSGGFLGGLSSTTNSLASRFTANVISSGRQLGNILFSIISWPFGYSFGDAVEQCKSVLGYNFSRMLNLILVLIIALMSYLWYRQYKNNKKLEDINKEIDLE